MLHEEEFFDAIDATLDKWDKEEEQVPHLIVCFVVLSMAVLIAYCQVKRCNSTSVV